MCAHPAQRHGDLRNVQPSTRGLARIRTTLHEEPALSPELATSARHPRRNVLERAQARPLAQLLEEQLLRPVSPTLCFGLFEKTPEL